ncbi:hypothetical protein VP01_5268g2, partial [Puccinia sorghi]
NLIKTTLSLDLPRLPTIGTILAPDDPTRQTILNMIYKEPGELEDLLQTVFGCHYLEDCLPVQTQYEYNLAQFSPILRATTHLQEEIQTKCVEINYKSRVLPIPK